MALTSDQPEGAGFACSDEVVGSDSLLGLAEESSARASPLFEALSSVLRDEPTLPQRDPLRDWAPAAVALLNEAATTTLAASATWSPDTESLLAIGRESIRMARDEPATFVLTMSPTIPESAPAMVRYVPVEPLADGERLYLKTFAYGEDADGAFAGVPGSDTPIRPGEPVTIRPPASSAVLVIGRVVRRATDTFSSDPGLTDPSFEARIEAALRDADTAELAQRCPDLSSTDDARVEGSPIVFVHGAAATALHHLEDLESSLGPLWRFEHDTFQSILENSAQLVSMVERRFDRTQSLCFVGHSRGGLVARHAAGVLTARGRTIDLQTYGAPHDGTGLVSLGEFAITGGLVRRFITRMAAPVRRLLGAQNQLAVELLSNNVLPEGWREMRHGSSMLREVSRQVHPRSFRSTGSIVDPNRMTLTVKEQFLLGFHDGAPNDLVVEYASARAEGLTWMDDLHCRHSDYFREGEVQKAVFDSTLRETDHPTRQPRYRSRRRAR